MSRNSSGQSGGFWAGLLMGAAAGAVAGLLAAPKTGRETRKLLRKSAEALPELAEDLTTSLQLQADRLSDVALQNWDGTLERLKEAIAAGIEAGVAENQRLNRHPVEPVNGKVKGTMQKSAESVPLETSLGDRVLGDRALGDRALGDRALGDRALGE